MSGPPDIEDAPLLPEGTDWEDRIEAILDGDDQEPEVVALGQEMARDALRVSKGELSDDAFNAKYRRKVRAVFGDDAAEFGPEATKEK